MASPLHLSCLRVLGACCRTFILTMSASLTMMMQVARYVTFSNDVVVGVSWGWSRCRGGGHGGGRFRAWLRRDGSRFQPDLARGPSRSSRHSQTISSQGPTWGGTASTPRRMRTAIAARPRASTASASASCLGTIEMKLTS